MRPQSNQRGIETRHQDPGFPRRPPGLNRTSVGLKHAFPTLTLRNPYEPQSNQRGIETWMSRPERRISSIGLNRTSVGLKRPWRTLASSAASGASIEPAWD